MQLDAAGNRDGGVWFYCDSVILPGFNFLHQCQSCLTGVHMCMCIVKVKLINSHSVIHELIVIDIDDS